MPSTYRKQPEFRELAEAMRRQGYTMRSFADAAHVDKATVFRLLHGQLKKMPIDLITKVQAASGGAVGLLEFAAFFQRLTENGKGTP